MGQENYLLKKSNIKQKQEKKTGININKKRKINKSKKISEYRKKQKKEAEETQLEAEETHLETTENKAELQAVTVFLDGDNDSYAEEQRLINTLPIGSVIDVATPNQLGAYKLKIVLDENENRKTVVKSVYDDDYY